MTDFLRPEVKAALWRWREALAAAAALGVGLWWVLTARGGVFLIGGALTVAGFGLLVAGLQRGRFRRGSGGPGVVEVDERQLTYFGPASGGSVAVAEITGVAYAGGAWLVTGSGGEHLTIPADAEGAEALFDVFAALPGMDTRGLLTAMSSRDGAHRTLWRRNPPRLH